MNIKFKETNKPIIMIAEVSDRTDKHEVMKIIQKTYPTAKLISSKPTDNGRKIMFIKDCYYIWEEL
jgi:hypothetical protein